MDSRRGVLKGIHTPFLVFTLTWLRATGVPWVSGARRIGSHTRGNDLPKVMPQMSHMVCPALPPGLPLQHQCCTRGCDRAQIQFQGRSDPSLTQVPGALVWPHLSTLPPRSLRLLGHLTSPGPVSEPGMLVPGPGEGKECLDVDPPTPRCTANPAQVPAPGSHKEP